MVNLAYLENLNKKNIMIIFSKLERNWKFWKILEKQKNLRTTTTNS